MTADYAARGAGRVDQYPVISAPVPPARWIRGVPAQASGPQVQAGESLPSGLQSAGIDIQRIELAVPAQLQYVGRLAAGSRARIQDAIARAGVEQVSGQLGRRVLH